MTNSPSGPGQTKKSSIKKKAQAKVKSTPQTQKKAGVNKRNDILRKPDSTKVKALKWKIKMNNDSVRAVADSFCQQAMSLGYSPPIADTNSNDLMDAFIVMNQEIYRAASGHIYLMQKHPEQLRAVMDGVFPTTGEGGRVSYSFDPESMNPVITETDVVKWGRLNGEYGTTGCTMLESPGIPSGTEDARLAACSRVFEKMEQAGMEMTLRTQTTSFKNSTSAFAQVIEETNPQDIVSEKGVFSTAIAGNEEEITDLWLAGLRLALPSRNRMTRGKHYKLYGPPSAYIGHRLFRRLTGKRGRMDNIRLQPLDIDREVELMGDVCSEIGRKYQQSSGIEGSNDPPFIVGDVNGFRAFVQSVVQTQFFRESPVHISLKRDIPGQPLARSLRYGNQFRERGNIHGAGLTMFWLNSEILRRLHFDSVKDDGGVVTYIYNVPFVSSVPPTVVSHPPTWGDTVFPTLDVATFTDGPIVVTNCDTVAGEYADYLDTYMSEMVKSSPYVQTNPVQRSAETVRGQHLTRLVRVTAPIDLEDLKARALGGIGSEAKMTKSAQLNLKMIEDGLVRDKKYTGNRRPNEAEFVDVTFMKQPKRGAIVEVNLEIGMIIRAPDMQAVQPFFSLNLPTTTGTITDSDSLVEAVSYAAARLLYQNYSVNKSVRDPSNMVNDTYRSQVHVRGGDLYPTELLKILKNKEDRGLGGLFSKIGLVADGVVGAFFPDSKLNVA